MAGVEVLIESFIFEDEIKLIRTHDRYRGKKRSVLDLRLTS